MAMRQRTLVTAAELLGRLRSGERPAILDVRWRLDRPDGRADYRDGHIPGAVYVCLDDELSDHSVTGRGRHPLPSGADLQAAARRWGIGAGQPVIVYDDWNRAGSSRAWWVLTAAGLPDVRILDGGLSAWREAGGELDTGDVQPRPGDVTVAHADLHNGSRATLTADDVAAGAVGTLLDARAPERFRGETEPVDPVAGHIPGAENLPSTSLLTDGGEFLDDDALRSRFSGLAGEVGVYCGSGVTAAVVLAALSAAGIGGALFPGSWSQWSSEPGRPVSRGD
ncbi:sulfurtransferase [Mycolicibacterium sp.]|uniref:sulfurtransferase n=1 Tax=Mycolicibacterium sp. TaxID=2320850 RepID=UPI0025E61B87|nr:sulfurtransferase [Mycolicibacterium sp.]